MWCWIKTTGTPGPAGTGARLGIDFYGANGRISGSASPQEAAAGTDWPNAPSNILATEYQYLVPWGTTSWTLITWSFNVPAVCIGDGGTQAYAEGQQGIPIACIPWCQILGSNGPWDTYTSWFSDLQFYINP
jgi:hypothetical protein